jgi:hypothetical protein
MNAQVIHISIGKFHADMARAVGAMLQESKARLENGIRIDHTNHATDNVSVWAIVTDANQVATFAPMLALAAEFTALGVRFKR